MPAAPTPSPPAPAAAPAESKAEMARAGPARPGMAGPVRPPPVPRAALPAAAPRLPAIDRRSLQRLRRGLIPIEARLDLHGHSQESAHAALLAFLRGASRAGKRAVLVITGKGAPAPTETAAPRPGRGVLRQAVPRWLREPEAAALVLGVAAAAPEHGGGGALYLLLRRTRDG